MKCTFCENVMFIFCRDRKELSQGGMADSLLFVVRLWCIVLCFVYLHLHIREGQKI